ncbi:FAS1-like dehydratase domain-containing protein [Novosphingobium cyanobacteriorum]|uniref:MaoC family dehydratase N-terminal domain-containing protein n=1 Tax=Novosphingobium cyanobacteriorum TaxID=3024215 RepID=A0ABT6CDB2_9SPHN|nr:MaoC family dehydratase N-terminal domain-containing protein [Novosphingobium cyanobacteriorum]MDF8331786.1 MaoC family dehydratase N-terminal domain-containing protein [Novosphingobium cyanobacteriorum]
MTAPALQDWIGRRETRTERVDLRPAAMLAALLNKPESPRKGAPLPPLWHWALFTPEARQSDLGEDGHPRLGGFMPPIPLPRRMWAGSRITWHDTLRLGDEAQRTTEITAIEEKPGSQGALVFLTLTHKITTARGLALREEQDLVYRAPASAAPPPPAPAEPPLADWRDPLTPDARLLFRYSAATFNTHRIHYDLPYARDAEGYPALVVHGPLTATLLVDRLLARTAKPLRTFTFRGRAPLYCDRPLALCGRQDHTGQFALWAESETGHPAMTATAEIEA